MIRKKIKSYFVDVVVSKGGEITIEEIVLTGVKPSRKSLKGYVEEDATILKWVIDKEVSYTYVMSQKDFARLGIMEDNLNDY